MSLFRLLRPARLSLATALLALPLAAMMKSGDFAPVSTSGLPQSLRITA